MVLTEGDRGGGVEAKQEEPLNILPGYSLSRALPSPLTYIHLTLISGRPSSLRFSSVE